MGPRAGSSGRAIRSSSSRPADDRGFSLLELLTVMALTAVLVTLGAFAIRHFWFVRAFQGAQDEVVTQLRQRQEQVVAETHPNVFGARFPKGGTARSSWGLINFNPTRPAADRCRETRILDFGPGVEVFPGGTDFAEGSDVAAMGAACRADPDVNDSTNGDEYVFFFGRGTATSGTVSIRQTALDNREAIVCVTAITGRVSVLEDGDDCA